MSFILSKLASKKQSKLKYIEVFMECFIDSVWLNFLSFINYSDGIWFSLWCSTLSLLLLDICVAFVLLCKIMMRHCFSPLVVLMYTLLQQSASSFHRARCLLYLMQPTRVSAVNQHNSAFSTTFLFEVSLM